MPAMDRFDIMPLTIRSYNEQIFQPRELIIVHNGKKPLPDSLVEQVKGDVKVIKFSKEKVMAAIVRNAGIQEARYDYVAKCDDDDWYFPSRLETMFEMMENDKSLLGAAYSLLSAYDVMSGRYGLVDKPNWYFDGSIMGRRSSLLEAVEQTRKGGMNPCPFKWFKDNVFRADITKLGRIRDFTQLLILFHGANDSTSWNYATSQGKIEEFQERFPKYVTDFLSNLTLERQKLK